MTHLFANWNVFDYVLAAIFLFSVIVSFFRGFVREAISLITWFLAFYLALQFSPALSSTLHTSISNPKGAYLVSFAIIFIIVMILGSIIKKLANGLMQLPFLGFFNKILGFVFGVVRGVLFVAIIQFIIQLTPMHDSTWVKTSQVAPHFQKMVAYFNTLIPKGILVEPASTISAKIKAFISNIKN